MKDPKKPHPTPILSMGDFYYNDRGLMVFTKKYHLKRGHCCGNGCKHCPYSEAQ
ncbi:DUF5522 domain-containing protein [Algoriphagus sp. C2-6-M1]|uniref:DUF5522 domain-containing protein n=1 Tax=Algoriphagus persicinus TaxID=3108754 RepID=UPI003A5CDDC7